MVQGGGSWSVVQSMHPMARARCQGGGPGRGGGGGVGAGERGAGAGGRGPPAEARRPQGEHGGGGRGGGEGGKGRGPRPSLTRANLEPRENTACLHMEEFQALPTEEELGDWMEKVAFKDDKEVLTQVLEGFKALRTVPWTVMQKSSYFPTI